MTKCAKREKERKKEEREEEEKKKRGRETPIDRQSSSEFRLTEEPRETTSEEKRRREREREGVTTIKTALERNVGWMDIRANLFYYSERRSSSREWMIFRGRSKSGQRSSGKVTEKSSSLSRPVDEKF